MINVKLNGITMTIQTIEDLVDALNDATVDDPRLVLQVGGEEFVLRVVSRRKRRTSARRRKADEEAFLSAFGSFKGVLDPDEFMKLVREGRSSSRPPIEFPRADELPSSESAEEDKPSPEQIDKLLSTFGALKGLIDPDELKAQIRDARGSNRPHRPHRPL
jgi:hypothetical protein